MDTSTDAENRVLIEHDGSTCKASQQIAHNDGKEQETKPEANSEPEGGSMVTADEDGDADDSWEPALELCSGNAIA